MDDQHQSPQHQEDEVPPEKLHNLVRTLETEVRFEQALDALARLEQQLLEVPGRLQYLNSRHVTYDVEIGAAVGQLTHQLRGAAEDARALAEREQQLLTPRIEALRERMDGDAMEGETEESDSANTVVDEVATVQMRVERADADIRSTFHDAVEAMGSLIHQISHLEQVGEWVKGAVWDLKTSELVLDGTPADYQRRPNDLYKGYLFLTTHRLVFERREEIKSGILFLQRKKQVSEIAWEASRQQIRDVLLNEEEHLLRVVTEGQPIATFILPADAETWQQAILGWMEHSSA